MSAGRDLRPYRARPVSAWARDLRRTIGVLALTAGMLLTGCAGMGGETTRAHLRAAEIAPPVRATGADAEQANIRIVRGLYEEVFDGHRLDRADRYVRPDYLQHTPTVPLGLDGLKFFYSTVFFKNFPDLTAELDQVIAQNDRVVSFATWRGRQVATGKRLLLHTADIYRVVDGKLAEHWDVIDYSALQPFGIREPAQDEPTTRADTAGSAAQQANAALAGRFVDEVLRQGRFERTAAYVAADIRQHVASIPPGLPGFVRELRRLRAAVPDLSVTVDHLVAGDDGVALFLTWRGHQAGSGRELHLHTADLYRVAGDRFTEHWGTVDQAALGPLGLAGK